MKKRYYIISIVANICLVVLLCYYYFAFPPNPFLLAEKVSNLSLDYDMNIDCFTYYENKFVSDGFYKIEFALSEKQLSRLVDRCKKKGFQFYSTLPKNVTEIINKRIEKVYLKYEILNATDYEIVILSETDKKLYLFVSY